ncbi:hypothetical protein HZH66_011774 [Vespula vulgaris]|uniref:Uncharacterized protein n=1 Tax=Vespula vulgaris TaxID=7454 RepID=A0A834JF06_VESVU|nr:hypothetical protein HZH66_011774 [Vespula vulgaris]
MGHSYLHHPSVGEANVCGIYVRATCPPSSTWEFRVGDVVGEWRRFFEGDTTSRVSGTIEEEEGEQEEQEKEEKEEEEEEEEVLRRIRVRNREESPEDVERRAAPESW